MVIDEHTIISQQQLHQVDLRLKETMVDERKFGGYVIVMVGNPAQMPPVMANSILTDVRTGDDLTGWNLCAEFITIIKLTENKRLDATDPDAVAFDNFLDKLRDSENMEEDWNILW